MYTYFIGEIPNNHIVRCKVKDSSVFTLDDLYLHKTNTRKEKERYRGRRNIKNITKRYVASLLEIPLKSLSEELYLHQKELIILKDY
jgi:hypothetical protein